LLIGLVLGTLHKIDRQKLNSVVWAGVLSAFLVSFIAALGLNQLGAKFEGKTEQIYEGVTMLFAAGVLTWMIFWMQRQSRTFNSGLELDVRRATMQNGAKALFLLAFLAVVREGIELVLFLTAAAMTTTGQQTLGGALLGLATAILLGWLLFTTTIKLDLASFFKGTSVLLIFFAAGLVAYGIHEFNEAGLIPPIIEHVWDINPILDEKSTLGSLLKALFGYNGNPSLSEIFAYLAYFVLIAFGLSRPAAVQPVVQEA
ncbi:MAG: FTR1 family protein, partial [Anaerolineales bacterium]|nr:FTR1 family protein [Anaerolineales bacterium]